MPFTPDAPLTLLHLGVGAFHRAHQAWYLQRLNDAGGTGWRLAAGNLRNDQPELMADLAEQGGAYTLETVAPDGQASYQRITALQRIVPWTPDLSELIALGAEPTTRIVSFTVTEAGYFLDQSQRLDTEHPDVAADLVGGLRTLYGAIVAILRARMKAGAGPVTLLSCDNLRSNGERFQSGLTGFLQALDDGPLLDWVNANVTCPNAMVDRITPRPSDAVRRRVQQATGQDDPCAVMGEEFAQWVVEEHFAAGRPAWEQVGVEMVDSVLPYEEAKIRILNATHSCIAWAGALKGLDYIHEGVADPVIRRFAHDYVTHDVIPCLSPSPIDLAAYRDTVLTRFSNPYIQDTNARVAADGFAKIPSFIAPTLGELLAAGRPLRQTARLPALFLLFLQARARGEIAFPYQDQAMPTPVLDAILGAVDPLARFAAEPILWGSLTGHPTLLAALRDSYDELQTWHQEIPA